MFAPVVIPGRDLADPLPADTVDHDGVQMLSMVLDRDVPPAPFVNQTSEGECLEGKRKWNNGETSRIDFNAEQPLDNRPEPPGDTIEVRCGAMVEPRRGIIWIRVIKPKMCVT